jgi:hypothetical protein
MSTDHEITPVSRRSLLRAAPIAALGGVVAMAAGATPAEAAVGGAVLQGEPNTFGTATTGLTGGNIASGTTALDVTGGITGDLVVAGVAAIPPVGGATVLIAQGPLDVIGNDPTPDDPAVVIRAGEAVGGYHDLGKRGLLVQGKGPSAAVEVVIEDGSEAPNGPFGDAFPVLGTGVQVTSESSTAINVEVTSVSTSHDAVTIAYAGTSRAFYAESTTATNINGTVTGVNVGHGIGVWGEQRNDTVSGYGVVGVAGKLGRGAQFTGGAAQVRLVPGTAATHPSTGKVGDFYVDSTARIWFCTVASTGVVSATWKKVTLS